MTANVVLPLWGANSAPQILYLDLRGHCEAEKHRGEISKRMKKEGKESDGRKHPQKYNFWSTHQCDFR